MIVSERPPRCGFPPQTPTQPPARRQQPLIICPQPFSRQWALIAGGQLEQATVKLRAAELFPAGATVPAVKPRLPAVVEKPTNELATVAFAASKGVQLVRGVAWT